MLGKSNRIETKREGKTSGTIVVRTLCVVFTVVQVIELCFGLMVGYMFLLPERNTQPPYAI